VNAKNRKPKNKTWLQTQYNPDARDRELRHHLPMDMIFRVR
jgi:hypothetical protein